MLGKLPVPGRPTILIRVGQGPTALAVGAGGGCLDIFTLIYPFSSISPSLWGTARYRLKYCLKGPLNPKQPTNQHVVERRPIWRGQVYSKTVFLTIILKSGCYRQVLVVDLPLHMCIFLFSFLDALFSSSAILQNKIFELCTIKYIYHVRNFWALHKNI